MCKLNKSILAELTDMNNPFMDFSNIFLLLIHFKHSVNSEDSD